MRARCVALLGTRAAVAPLCFFPWFGVCNVGCSGGIQRTSSAVRVEAVVAIHAAVIEPAELVARRRAAVAAVPAARRDV